MTGERVETFGTTPELPKVSTRDVGIALVGVCAGAKSIRDPTGRSATPPVSRC
jgi:hypothetical protein